MNTYLVADGGGTKTEFLWFQEDGNVLASARTAGSNATFIAPPQAAETVAQGIRACLAAAPQQPPPSAVLLFIPGFAPALPLLCRMLDRQDPQLMDDFWNAFYGALGAPYGIVALAGTGSFVAGRTGSGPLVTVGGWGPLFGDDGSGHHLGVLCLRAVSRLYDEGRPGGVLTELLLAHLNIQTVPALQTAAYRPGFGREQVARLSFLVEEAARRGDGTAAALFDEAADSLALQVQRLTRRLGADGLPVSVTGGMLNAGHWFTDAFRQALERRAPGLVFAPAKYSPLVGGALYLLAEQRGADLTDGRIAARLAEGADRRTENGGMRTC